ncbi:MAG: alkaline phosphatase family protein [Acidobacteriota bacterium]
MNPQLPPRGQIEVSELRERLRTLGYLDSGVDRFVLAPAQRERTPLGLAWRVSVRIGLLAALLLGPAAAIGVAARLPGLIAGARDAGIIVLYLAVIFGGAAAAASFAAAIIVRILARRAGARNARRVGLSAGWLVGIGCLVYLTLWWNAMGAAWSAPGRTLVAIAAAVAVSLVLGHAVSIATLALLARASPDANATAPAIASRRTIAIGIAAFAIVAGLLATSLVRGTGQSEPAPEFAIVPTGVRVVVVGIDGYDPDLYARWMQERVRATAPILQQLTISASADSVSADPAATWTTIATGVPPDRHGVVGLQSRRVVGLQGVIDPRSSLAAALGGTTDLLRLTRPAPVSGFARRYKMLWEASADKGLSAAVVNWWATWPASSTRAVVLSDRAVLRLEAGGEQSAEIAPPALYPPLRHRWPDIRKRADELAKTLRSLPNQAVAEILDRSGRLDAEQVLLARDPLLGSPDLLAVYLPGLDIAQHELLEGADARITSPSVMADRVAALPSYYSFLDLLIRESLLKGVSGDTVVIVVAHPGRVKGARGAVLSISGGPVRAPAGNAQPASILDVAPTVLYLLGMPVSRELAGRPWLERLEPEFVRRYPVRFVDTYGRYAAEMPASEGRSLDRETLERLRSLGYIR